MLRCENGERKTNVQINCENRSPHLVILGACVHRCSHSSPLFGRSLVDDVKNYVWILVLLSLILGCCLALAFWTFEKLNPIIESSDVSKKAKVMARGALYFIPWAMFLVTLSLPATFSQF